MKGPDSVWWYWVICIHTGVFLTTCMYSKHSVYVCGVSCMYTYLSVFENLLYHLRMCMYIIRAPCLHSKCMCACVLCVYIICMVPVGKCLWAHMYICPLLALGSVGITAKNFTSTQEAGPFANTWGGPVCQYMRRARLPIHEAGPFANTWGGPVCQYTRRARLPVHEAGLSCMCLECMHFSFVFIYILSNLCCTECKDHISYNFS